MSVKIADVEPGKNVDDLLVRVISVAPPRVVSTRTGRKTQLTEVLVGDETGTAVLVLWGFGGASALHAGKVIRIVDGWAKEWQGKVQLSLGRSGRFEEVPDDGSLPEITELLNRRNAGENTTESRG